MLYGTDRTRCDMLEVGIAAHYNHGYVMSAALVARFKVDNVTY